MKERGLSIAQAARRLGVTLSHVYQLVWAGRLEANKEDGKWQVSADSLAARLKAKEAK